MVVPAAAQDKPTPFAAYEAGRYDEALIGAQDALESDPDNTVWWALIAETQARLARHGEAAEGFARAAALDPQPAQRSYFYRAQALQLVYADRHEEARGVVRGALADASLETRNSLDWAMVAIAARDDRSAQDILSNEAMYAGFTRQTALDAGYSAKRRGLDDRAVRFFKTGPSAGPGGGRAARSCHAREHTPRNPRVDTRLVVPRPDRLIRQLDNRQAS